MLYRAHVLFSWRNSVKCKVENRPHSQCLVIPLTSLFLDASVNHLPFEVGKKVVR